jgi:antitoxin PrlF
MATLTITARGQVTLKKELLQHMGIAPGEKLEVDMLPGGRLALFHSAVYVSLSGSCGRFTA